MSAKRSDYSEDEIDAVIDAFDLGFMRNRIKQSDSDTVELMSTFNGTWLVFGMRLRSLGHAIIDGIKGLKR